MSDVQHNTQSTTTIVILFFFLVTLLILLFFLYKKLNNEANGKYTIRRIVYREGGLRDRVRGVAVNLGNRLGVQLWPQSGTDLEEENGEDYDDDDDDDDEHAQVNSHGNEEEENSDEDDTVQADEPKSGDQVGLNVEKEESKRASSASNSSDEEEQTEDPQETELKSEAKVETVKTELLVSDVQPKEEKRETSGPIVINLNQFTGSVIWSEEENGGGDKGGDVTAL